MYLSFTYICYLKIVLWIFGSLIYLLAFDYSIFAIFLDKKDPKEIPQSTTNVISLLYEYCQLREWPRPKDELVRDDAKNLEKRFGIRYIIGSKNLPVGVGRSKDIAKKRAAARALATLKSVDLRGKYPGANFGKVVELNWIHSLYSVVSFIYTWLIL